MNQFNFKSQVCTDRSQSERLLSLGLKKETADMVLVPSSRHDGSDVIRVRKSYLMEEDAIPAWSLHRLLELNLLCCEQHFAFQFHITNIDNAYEYLVNHTEWLIKEGYFNKEYMEE